MTLLKMWPHIKLLFWNQAQVTDRRNLEFDWLTESSGSSKLLHRRKSIDPAKIRDVPDFEGPFGNDVTTVIASDAPNLVRKFCIM